MAGISFSDGVSDGIGISPQAGLSVGGGGISDDGNNDLSPIAIFGSGLIGWYNASNGILNGSNFSQTDDLSGNLRHRVQTTGATQPARIANVINGYPAVSFDSTTKSLNAGITTAAFPVVGSIYFASVIRRFVPVSAYSRVYSVTNGSGSDFGTANNACVFLTKATGENFTSYYNGSEVNLGSGTVIAENVWVTVECYMNSVSGAVSQWVNGVLQQSTSLALSLNSNRLFTGANPDSVCVTFDEAESVFAASATADQQSLVRNYLRNKYLHY